MARARLLSRSADKDEILDFLFFDNARCPRMDINLINFNSRSAAPRIAREDLSTATMCLRHDFNNSTPRNVNRSLCARGATYTHGLIDEARRWIKGTAKGLRSITLHHHPSPDETASLLLYHFVNTAASKR